MGVGEDDGKAPCRYRGTSVADVLVVDDNEAVRSSLAEVLSSTGYTVATAEDGVVALALLQDMEVGLVLLDLKMPRIDGLTLLEMIVAPPPVVLLTAQPLSGFDHHSPKVLCSLQKPVDPGHLLDIVASAIGTADRRRRTP
jgi:CheY-like chemotaxis protein